MGGHDINGNAAVGSRYPAGMARVLVRIEQDTEPGQPLRNAGANGGGVLADPGSEHESVEALQRGRQHAGVVADPVDGIVDRKSHAQYLEELVRLFYQT